MTKNYYDILGVNRNANKEEIRRAYKRLAKKYHPDLNKESGATEKFKEINEAASVLADDRKREQYDRFGTTSEGFGPGASGFDFSDFGFGESFDFGDMFDSFFSRGFSSRRTPRRGADLLYETEISLEEVATGITKNLTIERLEACNHCKGTGAEDKGIEECKQCNGTGVIRRTQRTPFGIFTTSTTCNKCRGEGKHIKKTCSACDGEGRVRKERRIEIRIPAGVEERMRLRVAGEGEAGEKGGRPGDLFVQVRIRPHEVFEREGNDLNMEQEISFIEAALGAVIEVPTIDGRAKLKIPAGTQTDTTFRMRSKGLPDIETNEKGSQNVTIKLTVPKQLTKKQKELLKEFAKTSKEKGILQRIF